MDFKLRNAGLVCALSLLTFSGMARPQQPSPSAATPPAASEAGTPARTVVIHAKKFQFDPDEITLKKNQTVKLELTSDDVKHSLVVPGLGINAVLKKGEVTEVVVTPDKTGDFPGKCGVFCGFGHGHMHFIVHVVD